MAKAPLLAQAIDIQAWLEADRATPHSQRVKRDRTLGQQLPAGDDTARLVAWWHLSGNAQEASAGHRVVLYRRRIIWGLVVFGLFSGASVCSAALTYDGRYPVNLLGFLGVLIGLPLLLLVLTLMTSFLRGVGLSQVTRALSGFNVNRWLMGLWDKLGGGHFASRYGQRDARGDLAYWQVMSFSQTFAVAFFSGALLMFVGLIAMTDLAFGWSTTLELQAETVYTWFHFLAIPWSAVWPAAVPDMDLVTTSRYYRLSADMGVTRAARLGDWWPFVFMSIAVWGLLPRLLLGLFAHWRVSTATAVFLREHSEVTALLDRLSTPLLDLGQDAHERDVVERLAQPVQLPQVSRDASVLIWNEALSASQASDHYRSPIFLSTLQSDAEKAACLAGLVGKTTTLTLIVKGWEPPLLEFNDLLALIRQTVGDAVSVAVVPVGIDGRLCADTDLAVWASAIGGVNDAHVYVAGDAEAERN